MATDPQKLDYCNELYRKLQILNLPACAMNCYDVHCKNEMHIRAIDELMIEVLQSMYGLSQEKKRYSEVNAKW